MKIALIIFGVLAVIVGALIYEARPEQPDNQPIGPSSVIRGIRKRAKAEQIRAQRERAQSLENVVGRAISDASPRR